MKASELIGLTVIYKHNFKVITNVKIFINKEYDNIFVKLKGVGHYVRLCDIDLLGTKNYIDLDL